MTNFLFWNVRKQNIQTVITTACEENAVDVLILAECGFDPTSLLLELNRRNEPSVPTYVMPFNQSDRLVFFTRYSIDSIQPIIDDGGVAVRKMRPPLGKEILLIALHLPSKMHRSENEQLVHAHGIYQTICNAEASAGHSDSLVIGDFNMDPFEDGMIAAGSENERATARAMRVCRSVRFGRPPDLAVGASAGF